MFFCIVFLTGERSLPNHDVIQCTQNLFQYNNFFKYVSENPQIIVYLPYLSLGSSKIKVNVQITDVTLTDFSYTIIFSYNGSVGGYYLKWLAIDEQRIQVLKPPEETHCTDGAIYTYSHTFSQATQAFVFINGFEYLSGGIDFQLLVYSISNSNVQVQLKTTNSNLISIDYQIILGTKEAFYTSAIQTTGSGDATLGQYPVNKLQNSIYYYPFIGLSWDGLYSVRISATSTVISSDYQYTIGTYSGTIMTSVSIKTIQFFTKIRFPYYAKKYVVTKQFVEFPTNLITVKFIELNKSFNSDTSQTFSLLSTQSQLNLQIEFTLSKGKKIEGFFLKCNECGSNNKHIIKQSYYSEGNFVKFRIQLLQYTNSASTLVFSIISNKILIQQVINQVVDTYDILQLEFTNA